ncbi:hypothetical protein PV04_02357 [Phialophora macrospora]|uniref:4-coumarate-CoA ligase n=1 Tax=Phialophora macrospora TaxID=1851006 RepID=A0A0D2CY03_9EURO|nr:hypothetical protein PV04_02357 [Phialophora macrospora]
MPTTSELPDVEFPIDLPLWTHVFQSKHSVIYKRSPAQVRGFRDGVTGRFISYSQLRDLSTAGGVSLKTRYQLCPGQTVCIFGVNSLWYLVALFSILRQEGGIVSGASPASTIGEMTHYLRLANAKIIFTSKEFLPTALAAAKAVNLSRRSIVLLDGEEAGFESITHLIEEGQKQRAVASDEAYSFPPGRDATNVCAFLSFSSGTTGLPKAVQISHANMIAQCCQLRQISRPEQHNGVCLAVLPFFHIAGLVLMTFLPFFLNQEVVVLSRFEMREMLEAITKYRVTELGLVPPIVIRLVHDPIVSQYDLSNVKYLIFGAAPMSLQVITAVRQKFPHFLLRNIWGMTEVCGCATTLAPQYQRPENDHTVGKVIGSMSIKVVDPASGEEVQTGEVGEILLKGPTVTMGYLGNERATRETFEPDGWLHTGDLGFVDKDGFVIIQDRIKELIKVKGLQVAPAELEDLLLGHPLVEDVAVIGAEDPYAGEVPKAFVVLKDRSYDRARARDELLRFVQDKLSRHKWLDGGVEFVEEIPKSASGKILRRLLRAKHATGGKVSKL